MRILMFRLLMVLVEGLRLCWLPLAWLVSNTGRVLIGWADWAEIRWLLAVAQKKIGRKS